MKLFFCPCLLYRYESSPTIEFELWPLQEIKGIREVLFKNPDSFDGFFIYLGVLEAPRNFNVSGKMKNHHKTVKIYLWF